MAHTCTGIDDDVGKLGMVDSNQSGFPEVLQQELRFLQKFLSCLTHCEEAGKDMILINAIATLEVSLSTRINENSDFVARETLDKFEKFEPEITNMCSVLLEASASLTCSTDEILQFFDCLVRNFQDLANLKADIIVSLKNQITVLERKLHVLRTLDYFSERCIDQQVQEYFIDYATNLMDNEFSLSLLCLLKGKNEMMARGWAMVFSDQLDKFIPCTPDITDFIIGFLKCSKSSRSDKFQFAEDVVSLVEFLLECSADHSKDYIEIKEGLTFMISLFMDSEEEVVKHVGEGIFPQIDAVEEVLSLIFYAYMDGLELNFSSLQEKINKVEAEIRKLLSPSNFNFPATNVTGLINFLLENLKEMVKRNPSNIVFEKHRVMIVYEEIISLKPFLETILEMQKERGDLEALGKEIISKIFLTENVISSCFLIDHPIWYDTLQLSDVTEAIKCFQIEVKRFSDQFHKTKLPSVVTNPSRFAIREANPSSFKVVMGRENELQNIIEKLNRGTKQLDIVSIVGMAGLGKTTIGQKVYNDPGIRYYFKIRAWCCVSQVYKPRELYFDILTDVTDVDARQSYSGSTDHDLAATLRRKLKGQRYLIVLDDIWSVEAWNSVKDSFPDDNKGSCIVFTSRIYNLVSQAKPNSSPYPLRSLSDEERWVLLQSKLNHEPDSPLDGELLEMGKNIATNCRGLPLAVVLVAGILKSKKRKLWKLIESRTTLRVVSKGFMDALELSYNHLPDNLKPCFLYFGAFPGDTVVRAGKLISLWIAGLVPGTDNKSSYEVGEDYLSDLASRNLVILQGRSSSGGIKTCTVHDLLHNLCLVKSREGNFIHGYKIVIFLNLP